MVYMPIDSIVVDRTLRSDDNVEDLAKSILDQGLKFPVLIRKDRYLVDGLRRLEASKLAGFTAIEVVEAETVEDAAEALTRSHVGTPEKRLDYPPWRINSIWKSIIGLPRRVPAGKGGIPNRQQIRKALHLTSDNLIQSTVYTYKIAEQAGPLGDIAREAVALMEKRELNGYGGRIRIYAEREYITRADPSMSKAQAKRVITQAVSNLSATARGLQLVPTGLEAEAINKTEARELFYALEGVRTIISKMASKLNKIALSEETDE